ncbi:DUF7553 family protein [Halosimplex salinum]|uniref:DUF7553 family protein n=1 Tax=Halosimplex salinum TaxID=1710538 RepID=UPI000F4706E6|nr:hypothetical protein [Halosimplex salinum]
MNRHFEDTLYYLKRALTTAKKGVTKEAEPVERKVKELTGREDEPEPGRFESVRERAESEAKALLSAVRETVGSVRGRTGGTQ